jgi:general secretion pathway protein D
LLRQAREALTKGNRAEAMAKFRQGAAASGGKPQLRPALIKTLQAFKKAGITPADLVPQAAQRPNPANNHLQMPPMAGRGSVAQAGGAAAGNGAAAGKGAVAPAVGSNAAEAGGGVVPVQGIAGPVEGDGRSLFDEGMQLLAEGQRGAALEKFRAAWQFEADLPPEIRQQLKDKLTLLQPVALAPAGGPAPGSPLDTVDRQQQAERQRLYSEISNELAEAEKISTSRPLDALDRIVQLRRRVNESGSDVAFKQQMLSIVDRAYSQQERYVQENRASIDLQLRNEQVLADIENERNQRAATSEQISEFVEEFNQLMGERRFQEAETIAKKVQVLNPGSEIAVQMMTRSRVALRGLMYEEIQAAKEESVVDYLLDVDRMGDLPDPQKPLEFADAQTWEAVTNLRSRYNERDYGLNGREEQIRRRLDTDVQVSFSDRPLGEVIQTLSTLSGVPIQVNNQALALTRVSLDEPITLNLQQPIRLRSALNLILEDYGLTWMIQDDVLKIVTPDEKNENLKTVTYRVADLVVPIPNFISSYEDGMSGALRAAYQQSAQMADVRLAPMTVMDMAAARQNGMNGQLDPDVLAQYAGDGMPMPGGMGAAGPQGRGGGAIADFDSLMQLIETTIAPDTWEAVGGPSTMAPYRATLSLVVSTTTDVHEQIGDLLESLRRLQNLQVTIEVRFITLSDTFYERIGIDFDVAFDDNALELPQDDRGPTVTVGLSGENRLLTSDLDIQFNQGGFGASSPAFGNFAAGQGGQIGFAILSDIEAFFFLEAAQGDSRSNVMQAPKVTMFDGQSATINDFIQRPFVMGIQPVVGDFAVAQQPVIVVLNEGTQLNVQAVVSDDKRFVRLTLVPNFTQIVDVETFTYEGSRRTSTSRQVTDPDSETVTDDEDTEEVVVGTTVQQPAFATTSVSTTVSVPDGGTILMGGIKRLRENRNEIGVPMLSKIPYVNRLFRNVGIGREASSLMMMVTPRIIIQEEEEVAQTGFDPTGR